MPKPKPQYGNDKVKKRPRPTAKALANLKPAKKGEVRNPDGGRSHNPLVRAFNKINQDNYREALQEVLDGNKLMLDLLCDDPDVSSMKKLIAVSMREAIKNKSFGLLERITERLFGKVPDKLEVDAKNENTNHTELAIRAARSKIQEDV